MSYIRGEPDSEDETLHRKNCERVVNGMIWEERATGKIPVGKQVGGEVNFANSDVVGTNGVKKYKGVGRIVQVDGSMAIGNSKVSSMP